MWGEHSNHGRFQQQNAMQHENQTSEPVQEGRDNIQEMTPNQSTSNGGEGEKIIGFFDLTAGDSSGDEEVEKIIGFYDLTKPESTVEGDNTMRASTSSDDRTKSFFTFDDNYAIITYIIQHKCEQNIYGDEIWIDMLKTRTWNHTWQMLREQYIKNIRWDILTNSKKYPLSASDIGLLLQGFNNEQAARSSTVVADADDQPMPSLATLHANGSTMRSTSPALYRFSPSFYNVRHSMEFIGMDNLPEPPVPVVNSHVPMHYPPSGGSTTLPDVMRWCSNIHSGGLWPGQPNSRPARWHSPIPLPVEETEEEPPPSDDLLTYSLLDDINIIQHIIKYRREHNVMGTKLWKHMEKAGLHVNRTWRSLRDRYLQHIRLDIIFNPAKFPFLTPHQLDILKIGFNHDNISSGPDFTDSDEEPEVLEPSAPGMASIRSEDWGNVYSVKEDMAIINYIIQNKCVNNLLGNKVWKEMQKNHVRNRSWQSLRDRYNTRIKANIMAGAQRYPFLTANAIAFLKKGFNHD